MKLLMLMLTLAVMAGAGGAQEPMHVASAERAPRFLLEAKPKPVPIDVARSPALTRRISMELAAVTLDEALARVGELSGIRLLYSDAAVPLGRRVSVRAENLTVAAVLTELLVDVDVDVLFLRNGNAVVTKRPPSEPAPVVGTITGRVTEAATGNAVPQAQVSVSGSSLGASTREDGRYSIAGVPAGTRTVTVRRLGYDPQSREVSVVDGGSVEVDFVLAGATTRLAEIVTTMTGEQRKVEMGNSIGTLRADSLVGQAPVMTFGDLVQGRVPGVMSLTTSAKVGQAGTLRLRGLNSFVDNSGITQMPNDPVVVIDGVRMEATSGGPASPTAQPLIAGGWTGRLSDLNPSEIESIEVVKGPSAATLYGTDAGNGVIIIRTKRGAAGRTRWTGVLERAVLSQRLDDWSAPWSGGPFYAFGRNASTGLPQRCTLLQRAAATCLLDSLATFNAFATPETQPYKNGSREAYGLQVSGGTTGTTFFLSGDYEAEIGTPYMSETDQEYVRTARGVIDVPEWQRRPSAYRRINARSNLTTPLGSRGTSTLSAGFISNDARQDITFPFAQIGYRDTNEGWARNQRPAFQFAGRNADAVRRFIGSFASTWSVRTSLTLRATLGTDLSANDSEILVRRGEAAPGTAGITGRRSTFGIGVLRNTADFGITSSHELSRTMIARTTAGFQFNKRSYRGTNVNVTNLPLGGETIAGAGTVFAPSEATVTTAVAGGYLEEMVAIRERLFLTGALRVDGGSAFGKAFSAAVYPKLSASFLAIESNSSSFVPGLSSLRFRGAFGASGVQPGPTAALQQLQVIAGIGGAGAAAPGAVIGSYGNVDLKPERTAEIEGGVDAEFLEGRARIELTGYQRTSDGALINRPVASDVGGGSRWENLGSVRNRGLELLASSDLIRGSAVASGLTMTMSVNENRLLTLGQGVVVSSATAEGNRQDIGYPLYGQWGRSIETYSDVNNNGIIEPTEITLSSNQYIGPGFPPREVAIAPYIALFGRRLQLNGQLQYRGGFFKRNALSGDNCRVDSSCRAVNDASTSLAEQARAVAYSQFLAQGPYIEPASYVMLRELSAVMSMPQAWLRRLKVGEARLVLAGRNVAVLSREGTATAPESDASSRDQGVTLFSGGPPTYWVARLNVVY